MDSKLRHQQQYQQQHLNSGLMRFQSAPSSLLASLMDGESEGYDEFLHRSSRPEAESMIARFISGGMDEKLQRSPEFVEAIEQEHNRFSSASEVMYQTEQLADQSSAAAAIIDNSCQVMNLVPMDSPELAKGSGNGSNLIRHNSSAAAAMINNSCQVMNSIPMDSPELAKGRGNGSNLIRHNSSPAGLFSNLTVENSGYDVMNSMGNFRVGSGSNREAGLSSSRLRNQTNFIPRQANSPPMSQLSEMGTEGIPASFPISSWGDSPVVENLTSLKRHTDVDDALSGDACNRTTGLSHQYSFPKTSLEMAAMEKFLQFQDSVPCKVRAKRGYATHPRSIAERVRRTRISERMRKLQELVPNMDKQTNTADMLDLSVEYIKDLQKEMKTLLDDRASCTCSSKNKPNSNPTV